MSEEASDKRVQGIVLRELDRESMCMLQQVTTSSRSLPTRTKPWSRLRFSVQFTLLLGYLAFIPLGPYPIPLLGTKLDVLFGLGLIAALLPDLPKAAKSQPRIVSYSLLVYLAATFLSVATSDAPIASLRQWLVTLGYAGVAYIGSAVFASHGREIRISLLWLATLTSLAVFFLICTVPTDARFAFGPDFGVPIEEGLRYVDPNHTGIGLMLALVVGIPMLRRPRSYLAVLKWGATALCLCAIGAAALVTQSRTALVALSCGFLLAFVVLAWIGMIRPRLRHYTVLSGATLLACVAFAALLAPFVWGYLMMVVERLAHAGDDVARLNLLTESFTAYGESVKTILFGKGFMMLNPHNEYLRNLSSSGTISFMAFILFLSSIIHIIASASVGKYSHELAGYTLLFFILIAIIFYPLVKIFWVAILYLLVLADEARDQARRASQADTPIVNPQDRQPDFGLAAATAGLPAPGNQVNRMSEGS